MEKSESLPEYHELQNTFKLLGDIVTNNINYFKENERSHHTNFVQTFQSIHNIILPLRTNIDVLIQTCSNFDLNANCKGNGYRSIISIVESCLSQILNISELIQKNRDKLLFRAYQVYSELESYAQLLSRLLTIVRFSMVILEHSTDGWLFPEDTPKVAGIIDDLMGDFNGVNRDCFYGRTFGFQYALTVRQALQVIGVAMAAYGDGYIRHTDGLSRAVSSIIHSGKYFIDPDLRGKRVAELSQNVDIKFCKAFWSLTEEYGVQHAPLLVCPAMDVNLEFSISQEDIRMVKLDGEEFDLKFPTFKDLDGIKARLLSSIWREGQIHNVWKNESTYGPLGPKPRQRSKYLMFHCHGGGFVSQSSKSHEIYLRYWAKELRMPILSIDYSLAPEAPYPQALNEIFFAYVWALDNLTKLGTTGEKIVFTGDSAGANLVTALIFKAIKFNIRLPDCMVVAYPPYRLQYYPSPSRILCLMDPLLPLGVLKSCILAYVGGIHDDKIETKKVNLHQLRSSRLYNPYELDFGGCRSGLIRSFSETSLDVIRSQLDHVAAPAEDEYLSDCELPVVRERKYSHRIKKGSFCQYNNTSNSNLSPNWSPDWSPEKSENDITQSKSSPSILQSFRSQVSSQVMDVSRVSSKVFDDIRASLTQQIPSNVRDVSSKMFNDLKTGLSSYFDKPGTSKSADDVHKVAISNDQQGKTSPSRKRTLPPESLDDDANNKPIEEFFICKVCLHSSKSCTCNTPNFTNTRSNHLSKRKSTNSSRKKKKPKKSLNLDLNQGNHQGSSQLGGTFAETEESTCQDTIVSSTEHHQSSFSSLSEGSSKSSTSFNSSASLKVLCANKDPLLSPLFAGNDLLEKMPPVSILACSLDPLFDDSVDFARKLENLNKPVELYVLDRLPHGFLNFQVFSSEAHEACDLMIACIKKSLGMGMGRSDSFDKFSCS